MRLGEAKGEAFVKFNIWYVDMCHTLLTIFPNKYSWAAVSLFDVDDKIECPLIVFVVSEPSIENHFSCVMPNWKTGVLS